MRRLDDTPIDPDIAASLDAIDATLAGEAVDPEYAELAELALLLVAGRPEMEPAFAATLDQRAERRFMAVAEAPAGSARRVRRWAQLGPLSQLGAAAVGLTAVVALVVAVSVLPGSGGSSASSSSAPPTAGAAAAAGGALSTAQKAPPGTALRADQTNGAIQARSSKSTPSIVTTPNTALVPNFGAGLQPPNNGRKIVQGAQLSLSAPPTRIDDVAQEVFNVIGAQNGIVNRSTVTATGGNDGYAQFELSVPSANLAQTMTQLSRLRYANVVSRTDTSQDVNDQYVGATHKLADDQALRTSLLKQLANATTQEEIDSLNARLHDVENAIAGDQAALRSLNHKVNNSQITLTINAASAPAPASHSDSGFTLGKAAHDAGRVLTVAAGVALIALAVLVPIVLVGALAWWIATTVRRRRREHALDVA